MSCTPQCYWNPSGTTNPYATATQRLFLADQILCAQLLLCCGQFVFQHLHLRNPLVVVSLDMASQLGTLAMPWALMIFVSPKDVSDCPFVPEHRVRCNVMTRSRAAWHTTSVLTRCQCPLQPTLNWAGILRLAAFGQFADCRTTATHRALEAPSHERTKRNLTSVLNNRCSGLEPKSDVEFASGLKSE